MSRIWTVSLASRYLGVRQFGALSAAMAYASLFAVLTDLGLYLDDFHRFDFLLVETIDAESP